MHLCKIRIIAITEHQAWRDGVYAQSRAKGRSKRLGLIGKRSFRTVVGRPGRSGGSELCIQHVDNRTLRCTNLEMQIQLSGQEERGGAVYSHHLFEQGEISFVHSPCRKEGCVVDQMIDLSESLNGLGKQ